MDLRFAAALGAAFFLNQSTGVAQESGRFGWLSGDWALTIGATGLRAPSFEGSKKYLFSVSPVISFSKSGKAARFSSRNDNISFALIDNGKVRAGLNGKLIFAREAKDELAGLDAVRFGGELGAFAEVYPLDWLRLRGEVRHGIKSHKGLVADIAADAFYDVTPDVRISAGPRASFASANYFDAYYGVDSIQSAASGLSAYKPKSGVKSVGVGGAISWKTTDKLTTTLFSEYARLTGPAAQSSLVQERGSKNQFTIGLSLTYRFDFSL